MYRRVFLGNILSAIAATSLLPVTALAATTPTKNHKHAKKSKHHDATEKDAVATIAKKDKTHKHHSPKSKHHSDKEKYTEVNPPDVSSTETI